MKKNKENSEHYHWGASCSGWHLVKTKDLSVIEELMPPNTQEQLHYHNRTQQFFYILKGQAVFEMENEVLVIQSKEGIHIQAGTKHRIKNETAENLEFLVISQPTSKEDRINAPFIKDSDINLNGKYFKSIVNSDNGEVSSETIFHYRQKGDTVWATYEGGAIKFGTLSGSIKEDKLEFNYQHQNTAGDFLTGKCKSIVKKVADKIRLKESWQWTCGDYSSGTSLLEEIK